MNEKKQKKIRAFLINFINEELNRKKRNNKHEILINSTSLDILSQKNMQCKIFSVQEHNYFYQQNIDIGWLIGVNFDINKSGIQKPLVNFFTNKCENEIEKIDSSDGGEEKIEIINKETIIKKNTDRILYIHHPKEIGIPLGNLLFRKKEISEKKFIKENNGIYSGRTSKFMLNKIEKEKDDIKIRDSNSIKDDNPILIKRYSNITLETELSRIIKYCHDEDYQSSQEHFISESRRSELNKELKIAKMYAKKLNLFCKRLKKKIEKKYAKDKDNSISLIKTRERHKNNKYTKKGEIETSKGKSHIIKKIKYTKIISKPRDESDKNKEKYPKFNNIEKSKTFKYINDSNRHNLFEKSSKTKGNITSRDNTKKERKNILKINQFKRHSSTFRNKLMTKLKQVYFKSPKKIDIIKKEKIKQNGNKEYKKLNITKKLLDKDFNQNTEDHTKKLIKMKKNQEHKELEKTSIFRVNKISATKRSSMGEKMNSKGLEKINFFKTKKNSHEPYLIRAFRKKSKKKKEKDKLNINNNINNNSTSISQRKDTSDSSEIILKNDDKKKSNRNKNYNKNMTYLFKKKKEIDNYKRINKRKSSNYDNVKIHKLKRISPLKMDRDKRNRTTEKNGLKFGGNENNESKDITNFDNFNLIDEFLYKIKLKRGKNNSIEIN